jgi:hypothetical protein
VTLADGCRVPACRDCLAGIEGGRRVAEERGLYDANEIRGGDYLTRVEKKSEGGIFLKQKFVETKGITSLKIKNSGEEVTFENKNKKGEMTVAHKWQVKVSYDGMTEGDPNLWTMNNTSFNACIELFGNETNNWVGKTVEISIGGEGDMKNIQVDTIRSKKNL